MITLEYRIDGGSAVELADTGIIPTTGSKSVEIRAVNAIGAAPWSDTKTRTAIASNALASSSRRSFDFGSQNVTALRSSSAGGWCSIGELCSIN